MSTANDIMTKNVLTAKVSTPFNDVVKVFTNSKIKHLPITNANGALRAIISSSDVLKAIHELDQFAINYNGFSLEKRLDVKDEMSSDVFSVSGNADIQEVVKVMVENELHAVPIIEDEELIGIITSNDILRAIHLGKLKVQ